MEIAQGLELKAPEMSSELRIIVARILAIFG